MIVVWPFCFCWINRNVVSVCAEEGDLFLWGSNKHGQLSTAEPFLPTPALLKPCLFKAEKVLKVWSGWTHNVAQTGTSALVQVIYAL